MKVCELTDPASAIYCPEGAVAALSCPPGFFCPEVYAAVACDLGDYCPVGSR